MVNTKECVEYYCDMKYTGQNLNYIDLRDWTNVINKISKVNTFVYLK